MKNNRTFTLPQSLSNRFSGLCTAALVAAMTCAVPLAHAVTTDPSSAAQETESKVPFMDLITIGGDEASIAEHFNNGKWTLVMLWATDCHICKEQKPMMSAAHNERKNIDFTVMGIAIDGHSALGKVNQYLEKYNPSFPSYVGDITTVAFNYEVLTEEQFRGTPTYLLFNPENELMASQPGRIGKEALFDFIAANS